MPIQIGDLLGDYEVTGVLGRGGMGKVYRVRSRVTDREEAMKIVLPDLEEAPGLAERFLREIRVHASLLHPNIAALHSAQRIEGRLVMFLELVEGVSLEETLRRGPLEVSLALHYLDQLLSALSYAHAHGVIHRDIKPANILIAAGGVVKLTDFGIARPAGGERLTGAGLAVGTLAYMAPEQIRSGDVDARSDIYSLGCVAYEMLTGRRPIQADSEHALMNAQLTQMPPDPAAINPLAPRAVCDALLRALAKDPAQRYPDAAEFQAALRRASSAGSAAHSTGYAAPLPPPAPAPSSGEYVASRPELGEIQARLSRVVGPIASRMVATAARRYATLPEIVHALASEIDDPAQRASFLQTNPGTKTAVSAPATPSAAPSAAIDPLTLDCIAQALAPYLGPIAKVLTTRSARTARNAEELCHALAAEIASDTERRQFLASVRTLF